MGAKQQAGEIVSCPYRLGARRDAGRVRALNPASPAKQFTQTITEHTGTCDLHSGSEFFRAIPLKLGYKDTFHKIGRKHPDGYVNEIAGRHNIRGFDTLDQMAAIVRGMDQKRPRYTVSQDPYTGKMTNPNNYGALSCP